ncbi:hypothetical protein B9Q12_01260 [Candidatus Marsarchaeota G2 archaeon ECH_B_SAG-G06]|uniref:Uncharacterized protein n=1 Tax=Candidatus Marsarchaeota G2 archaeon ECH_B_SAG-G06 TaxID=1978166 RepID=A0A2R6C2F7_9ARCH|nr:MAG: hypothetical protein B9Q12_01260 [Candidatus Marsarchaeota G2 archaeon ECH_B_SAG-G06]
MVRKLVVKQNKPLKVKDIKRKISIALGGVVAEILVQDAFKNKPQDYVLSNSDIELLRTRLQYYFGDASEVVYKLVMFD